MKQNELKNAINKIELSQERKNRIVSRSVMANREKERYFMKSKKKFTLIAIAATLVLGITVFAANGVVTSWIGRSSSTPDYTSLPTVEQCIEDVGYTPILMDTFQNGYAFVSGNIIKNELQDDNNRSVKKYKSLTFRYEKDGDDVIFSQDNGNTELETNGDVVATVNGIDIYYYSYTNKGVPVGYVQTEEDKQAEENGELVFSYGADEVRIDEVQSVSWTSEGTHYNLMQINGQLSVDELTQMANEAILAR